MLYNIIKFVVAVVAMGAPLALIILGWLGAWSV